MSDETNPAEESDLPQADSESGSSADAPADALADDAHPEVREAVIGVLKTIFDPEIPVNLYDLGLIYEIAIDDEANVSITMTLTSPACPVAETLPPEVQAKLEALDAVRSARVDLTWEPTWGPDRMTEGARLTLNVW